MMQASQRRGRSRSRSPNKGSGWGDTKSRERSRSRSAERFDQAPPRQTPVGRSFHESMMGRSGSSPVASKHRSPSYSDNRSPSAGDCQKGWEKEKSPPRWQGDGKFGNEPRAYNGEEEEGMIPEDVETRA